MLVQERQTEILNMLMQHGGILKMTELARRFDVSNETIRRDLEYLQDQKLIQRVYGGAILLDKQNTSARAIYSAGKTAGQKERAAIGRAMASMIQEGESLFLSTGATVLEVAKHLKHLKNLTIMTNSLPVVHELASTDFTIYVVGGKLSNTEMSTFGEMALDSLRNIYVDRTIIGAGGITLEHGISDFHDADFTLRSEMRRRTNQLAVVCQSDKFGRNAFAIRNSLDVVDMIVTDSKIDPKYHGELMARNIKLITADV